MKNEDSAEIRSNLSKIEYLYGKYRYLMFDVAYHILKDTYWAEDAVNQAFERIIKNIHKIEDSDSRKTKTFLVIICRNVAFDIYKQRTSLNWSDIILEEVIDEKDYNNNLIDYILDKIVVDQVICYIKKLNSIYQDVMILRYYMDYDYEKIAHFLNITNSTARKRVERGRIELLTMLERDGIHKQKEFK